MTMHSSPGGTIFGGPLNSPLQPGMVHHAPPVMPVSEPPSQEITHIEIRRVQNGFVVQAINMREYNIQNNYPIPARWSFIAKDTTEIATVLESVVTGSIDLKWVPSYDLPIVDLVRRVRE